MFANDVVKSPFRTAASAVAECKSKKRQRRGNAIDAIVAPDEGNESVLGDSRFNFGSRPG